MRLVYASLIGVSLAIVVARPGAVWGFYHEVYPSDPQRQEALDACAARDQWFNRLDRAAREACYRHFAEAGRRPAGIGQANPVDLRRAAGEGAMPHNDIRAQEYNAAFDRRPAVVARVQ